MIAYFITCHGSVEYLDYLLISIYRSKDFYIIHCDKTSYYIFSDYLQRLRSKYQNIEILEPRLYSWAGFSQVATTLDAIKTALEKSTCWTHFVTLSEQHLPVCSPEQMEAVLVDKGSLVGVRRVVDMGPEERLDVYSRFTPSYQELPGVGSFTVGSVPIDSDFIRDLYHGSNWYILSRVHCSFLLELNSTSYFSRFMRSVHADEHAIQTALWSVDAQSLGQIENKESTFVAWPHLTDNNDLVMVENNFWQAQENDMFFVRKRPRNMPESISRFLRSNCSGTLDPSPAFNSLDTESEDKKKLRASIVEKLSRHIAKKHPTRRIEGFFDQLVRPYFYAKIPDNGLNKYKIAIVSEDLDNFKILLVRNSDFHGYFSPYRINRFEISLIRARVEALFFQQEFLDDALVNRGFVSIKSAGVEMLLRTTSCQIEALRHIEENVALFS